MGTVLMILAYLLQGLEWIIVIWALMTWFPALRDSKFGEFIAKIADLVVGPIQRIVPPLGMIDFSAIIALILLQAAQYGIMSLAQSL